MTNSTIDFATAAPFLVTVLIFAFWMYALFCLPLQILAKKTNTPNAWLAWIPFANLYLMCKIGQKPGWWMLFMLIPFVQIIFIVLAWMGIAGVRNRPQWLGILIIIPLINFILPWYLALSDEKTVGY